MSPLISKPGQPLLQVINLKKHFPVRGGIFRRTVASVKAVDGVSFQINTGETLGLVGESGCGKTTVGRALLRLIPHSSGEVRFNGVDLLQLSRSELKPYRQHMQIIFQDPYGSLNPRMTIAQIIGEGLRLHAGLRGKALRAEVSELIETVGLKAHVLERYPHEFSGGQRQRIGIARALALRPAFIVCDEPTSALDVSIRAQIVNLLQDLQRDRGISYLMISHDLGVVRHVSKTVAVMYLGKIVEQSPTFKLYEDARHPYTGLLLAANPVLNPRLRGPLQVVAPNDADTVPSPINVPSGCAFHPRCPLYAAKGKPAQCHQVTPELLPLAADPQHLVRCHFPEETHYSVRH